MATFAVGPSRDVRGWFALAFDSVVTGLACGARWNACAVAEFRVAKGQRAVAAVAALRGAVHRDVIGWHHHRRLGDARACGVTGLAIPWRSLEHAIDVTRLAALRDVRTGEGESRFHVI